MYTSSVPNSHPSILTELYDVEPDECDSDMDLGFLLGEERPQHIVDDDDATSDDFLLPTPIDTNRMNVVRSVVPARDFLCASEREHLQDWVKFLKVPLQYPKSVSPLPVEYSSSSVVVVDRSENESDDASSSDASRTASSAASVSWNYRFQELLEFRRQFGHVNVPYDYPPNPPLAQWVKRQRHQYRLLKEGRHSNLTPARLEQLQAIDYCWDSRQAHWLDRFYELEDYFKKHGHIRVSKRIVLDRPLAVWLKRQRHQGRLFLQGKADGSNMTQSRLNMLQAIGVRFTSK